MNESLYQSDGKTTMAAFQCDVAMLFQQYKLFPIPLGRAGNPVLSDGEVEIKIAGDVSVLEQTRSQKGKVLISACLATLTSHRIVIIVDQTGENLGWGFNLSDVAIVDDCSTFFSRSTRINFQMRNSQIEIGFKFSTKITKITEKDERARCVKTPLVLKSLHYQTRAKKKRK